MIPGVKVESNLGIFLGFFRDGYGFLWISGMSESTLGPFLGHLFGEHLYLDLVGLPKRKHQCLGFATGRSRGSLPWREWMALDWHWNPRISCRKSHEDLLDVPWTTAQMTDNLARKLVRRRSVWVAKPWQLKKNAPWCHGSSRRIH